MDTPPGHEAPSEQIIQSTHLRPDAKTQRYDRQLRLWAASGQAALEGAQVLVVNGSAVATSTLKNLVLPGVGHFTILDDALVTEADLGNNFFLEPGVTQIGSSRAEEAANYLCELNDGVKASCIKQSVTSFLESSSEPLAPYTLVICVGARPVETLPLSDACWEAGVPMIAVRNSGFLASVRTQVKEAHFIETHPEQEATLDLRLDAPWPDLEAHAQGIDLHALSSHEYAHVPPVVILLQGLQKFRDTHDGSLPKNYAEKNALKKLIAGMKKGGVNADEENFEDAIGMVMKAVKPTVVPATVERMFKDKACDSLSHTSPPFWFMLRALRDFVESPSINEGRRLLPLTGSLPDMKATSAGYASLLGLYRSKAQTDLADMRTFLLALLKQQGLAEDSSFITEEMLAVFVKNAAFIEVVRGRKMRDEYERPVTARINKALQEAAQGDPFRIADEDEEVPAPCTPVHFYLALRAADLFNVEHSRWPGSMSLEEDPEGAKDLEEMMACGEKVVRTCTASEEATVDESLEKALKEVMRGGGSDLPTIAALVGGVVAQEAIKIMTKQYVPLSGTWVFDAMTSIGQSFDF